MSNEQLAMSNEQLAMSNEKGIMYIDSCTARLSCKNDFGDSLRKRLFQSLNKKQINLTEGVAVRTVIK